MSNINFKNAIHGENISKKFSGFELNIPDFRVPEGFATALIGENGAGKSTLLNILAGVRMDYKGSVNFFEEENSSFNGMGQNSRGNVDPFLPETESMRERIGFTAPNDYFLPEWTVKQVREASKLLFSNFDENKFDQMPHRNPDRLFFIDLCSRHTLSSSLPGKCRIRKGQVNGAPSPHLQNRNLYPSPCRFLPAWIRGSVLKVSGFAKAPGQEFPPRSLCRTLPV